MNERDLLSIDDLNPEELGALLDRAADVKDDPAAFGDSLKGRNVVLLFEKPSLRTRVSFEIGVTMLGGNAVVIGRDEIGLDSRESIEDVARVLSRWADAIVMRTFGQDRLDRMADASSVPIVNALSDFSHPCQALSDLQTIREKKKQLAGTALAYLGDGNNVAHSLMFGGAKLGMDVRIACPEGFEPFPQVVERCKELSASNGGHLSVGNVVAEAATGADVLYTDVWTSMGKEGEADSRKAEFERFQINPQVIAMADPDAIVMHCLPAHRGEEISADVIDGPRSVVWDQAENRLYAQMALLDWLIGNSQAN
ncbi:MAG TPA: ornithine carbamoyltransferase [Actinomycetota bacterium]|nr:ornithine carbamoyltransferase [Actinomycetota bacterium]